MQFSETLGQTLDRPRVRRVILVAFGAIAALSLRVQSPLAWDEAVYAARGKDLARTNFEWDTITSAYWSDLRAPGFPGFLAAAFELFGESDLIARLVVVGFSVGLLWMIATTLDLVASRRVGTTAIVIAALCPGFLATSTLAFADHPAAFFAVVGVYFLLHAHVRGAGLGLAMVPIALGIATTMRFGATMFVGAALFIVAGAIVLRAIRERDPRALIPYVGAGAVTGAVVLFLLGTTFLTRNASPLEATDAQVDSVNNSSTNWLRDLETILTPGAVDYGFNGAFWGWSYALVFVVVVVAVTTKLLMRGQVLWLLMFAAVSLTPVVMYGLSVRQYVTTYLSPQFAIGAAMLAWAIWLPAPTRSDDDDDEPAEPATTALPFAGMVRTGLVLLALGTAFVSWRSFEGVEAMHERLGGFEQVRLASIAADDMLGSDCRLFTTRVPQVAWYSDCNASGFSGSFQPDGESVGGGMPWDEFVQVQASRVDLSGGATIGFLLLEGASGQPRIDDVAELADPDNSVVLRSASGRRVALFEVNVG